MRVCLLFQNIVVEVLADDVPELSESYDVILQNPTGGAVLASAGTTAVVIIDANDDPNGIIHLNFNETRYPVLLIMSRSILGSGR